MCTTTSRTSFVRIWPLSTSSFYTFETRRDFESIRYLDKVGRVFSFLPFASFARHLTFCNGSTRIVDGEYVDDRYTGGVEYIFELLWQFKDKFLVEKYGIWLVGQDRNLGLKVCCFLLLLL